MEVDAHHRFPPSLQTSPLQLGHVYLLGNWHLFAYFLALAMGAMSGENLGHNGSRPECSQVQPVTCCDLLVFFYHFKAYSTSSSI